MAQTVCWQSWHLTPYLQLPVLKHSTTKQQQSKAALEANLEYPQIIIL